MINMNLFKKYGIEKDTMLNAALNYAEHGLAVFPLEAQGKKPITKHGLKDASTDPDKIREMFAAHPYSNIGMACGSQSGGIIVVDIDVDEEKDKNGNDSLKEWEHEHGALPDTAMTLTGRGGNHYLYRSAGDTKSRIACKEGIDIRADGGYIVLPPSIHPNGAQYAWEYELTDFGIVNANQSVIDLMNEGVEPGKEFKVPDKIEPGSRNDIIYKLACSMQARGNGDKAILAAAKAENLERCDPPLDDEEVEKTVSSALRKPKGTAPYKEENAKPKMQIRKLKKASALLEKDIPEPEVFVGVGSDLPLLVEGTCILSAKPKLGKSWLALKLCLAVAAGEDFLGYKVRKCSTLYLDLETSEAIQKKRVTNMLGGEPCPDNFYLESDTNTIENGFVEQIESYLKDDPDIGIVVIDVFQLIRSGSKSFKETEYEHAYRDITPLNELAQKHHISIVLVCHDRKAVDPDDPFSNILGSTGLQGAASQMMVMFKKNKDDPIHISVKGKTIDGLIDMNVKLENYKWSVIDYKDEVDQEAIRLDSEYKESSIRTGVLEILNRQTIWRGRCGQLIQDAAVCMVPIQETAKNVGGFLHRHVGRFLGQDDILVRIIQNGGGSCIYEISKSTVDTVDGNEGSTVDGFYKSDDFNVPEEWNT
jgi:hypothetical protein